MIEVLKLAAGVGALAWYGASLYVGGRLMLHGLRSDNPPARWIGTYLLFAMGLGSILYGLAVARTVITGAPMTTVDRGLIAAHFVAAVIANYGLLTFTHRVFRRDSRLAALAAPAILLLMIAGALGHGITTRFDGHFVTAYAAMYLAGPVLANGWAAIESLLYYRLMRKRLQVGLADPLLTNRFLLWGMGAGTAALLLGFNLLEMQVLHRADPVAVRGVQTTSLVLMAVLGVVCAGAYLFAFFPAHWYVERFVGAREGEA